MNTPRISIVTPSFNQGEFIGRTIESVQSQGLPGLEYLGVDGASTARTLEVLKSHGDSLVWFSEPDKGPASALNKGFARSRAPILGWLNSDDLYYPGALSAVLEFFAAHPEVDVLYGQAEHIDGQGAFIERYPTEPFDFERLTQTCFISQPAAFFRREVFERHGPLAEDLRSMDYEYWLRIAKAGARFAHLPRTLAATRLHPGAFTVASRLAAHHEVNEIMLRHLGRVPERWLFNLAHAELEAKGESREHRLYNLRVNLRALRASLIWNAGISPRLLYHAAKTTLGLKA